MTYAEWVLTVHVQRGLSFAGTDVISCFALDNGAMMTTIHRINCLLKWKIALECVRISFMIFNLEFTISVV